MALENILKHELDERFMEKLRHFLEVNDLVRMSRNLRKVFFDYLRYQTIGLDVEFDLISDDLEPIIEFLELAHEHTEEWHRSCT